jgi:carbamoyltransferase
VAIEKERLTRTKHDGGNDTDAITYCLRAEGIRYADLELVVQNANFGMFEFGNDWYRGRRIIDHTVPVVTISHHLAHAFSAVGTCPFDGAVVLVIDGCGNAYDDCSDLAGASVLETPPTGLEHLYFEKDSYYALTKKGLSSICKDFSPWGRVNTNYPMHPTTTLHSIGGLYLAVSTYVFRGFEDPGKLMGLASYGRRGVYDTPIFDLRDGRVFVRYEWMRAFVRPCRSLEQFKADFQYFADIARWTQDEVERAVMYIVAARSERSPHDNLAYAGGVALNAAINRSLVTCGPFKNVYIQPAAADSGLALGCAYYGWTEVLGRRRVQHDGSTCFGARYEQDVIDDILKLYLGRICVLKPLDYVGVVAHLLAEGKIVAWFHGPSEFGPRSLGHRSILADPRIPGVRDFINREIKQREDFRPFAPSVPDEECGTYFEICERSPYMLLVASVRDEWRPRLPSIVHRDGSARIQTVSAALDPIYHRLHLLFKELTGISVLLNTSFNKRGMPIVESPKDAIDFFLEAPIDALSIGSSIVSRGLHKDGDSRNMEQGFRINESRTMEQVYDSQCRY